VTLFALATFFLQSYLVQTHVHPASEPVAQTLGLHSPAPGPLKTQDPVDQCRLCQELIHAGAFITPTASAVAASQAVIQAAVLVLPRRVALVATAFAWQSRAPPRR
jgi:hypothetical protein